MAQIHPTAIVSKEAEFAPGVEIGPWCEIRGKVRLGEGVRLMARVSIEGPVEIGAGTLLYPGACIGMPPQDVKFKPGDPTPGVRIGCNTLIREFATVHAASKPDAPTIVGDRVFMMVNSHVGHDSKVGNDAILVNSVLLAGHVDVGERAIVSGGAAIHQFCRVGRLAMVTGVIGMTRDVPPFCLSGTRNRISGLNVVGMRRAGIPRDDISKLRTAFREAFRRAMPRQEIVACLEEHGRGCSLAKEMADFVRTAKRAVCTAAAGSIEEETVSG